MDVRCGARACALDKCKPRWPFSRLSMSRKLGNRKMREKLGNDMQKLCLSLCPTCWAMFLQVPGPIHEPLPSSVLRSGLVSVGRLKAVASSTFLPPRCPQNNAASNSTNNASRDLHATVPRPENASGCASVADSGNVCPAKVRCRRRANCRRVACVPDRVCSTSVSPLPRLRGAIPEASDASQGHNSRLFVLERAPHTSVTAILRTHRSKVLGIPETVGCVGFRCAARNASEHSGAASRTECASTETPSAPSPSY